MKTPFHLILLALGLAGLWLSSCANPTASGSIKSYPLDTCLVTGNELGSMGTPITQLHGNQEIKFCCKPCVKKFNATPQKYLAKLPSSR